MVKSAIVLVPTLLFSSLALSGKPADKGPSENAAPFFVTDAQVAAAAEVSTPGKGPSENSAFGRAIARIHTGFDVPRAHPGGPNPSPN